MLIVVNAHHVPIPENWFVSPFPTDYNLINQLIYISFLTAGSPIVIYLMMGFVLDIRKIFRKKPLEDEI